MIELRQGRKAFNHKGSLSPLRGSLGRIVDRGLRGAKTAPLAPGYSLSARGGKLGFRDRNYTS